MKTTHIRCSLPGLAALLALSGTPIAASAAEPSTTPPQGVSASDWIGIRAAHEAATHRVVPADDGLLKAWNPGQEWTTGFDGRGFTTHPAHSRWTWGLELERYGFGNKATTLSGTAPISHQENKVTYQWNDSLAEWFINDSRGVEQGWTLSQRPEGASPDVPLHLDLKVRGELKAEVAPCGASVSFTQDSGGTALTYSGLKAWDADGKALDVRFEARRADALRITVQETQARYPITIDPIAQQAYLKASNTETNDRFGFSVAVSGSLAVVGAPAEKSNASGVNGNQGNNSAVNAGAAYVFVRNGNSWSQEAYLKASNSETSDVFGISVDVSETGQTIIVGASGEDSNANGVNGNQNDNGASGAGAAYIFVRNGGTWSQQAYLKASNSDGSDQFGESVAVNGDTCVVGARAEDSASASNQSDNAAGNSGAAYVYTRNGSTWIQRSYLKASNVGAGDLFGDSVAVGDDTIVIGAPQESSAATGVNGNGSDNTAPQSGAAYIFTRSGNTFVEEAYVKASNTGANDGFGNSVAVSGASVLVGAPFEDSSATSVNGDENNDGSPNAGAAYVFTKTNGDWLQEAYLKASNAEAEDFFGSSVALSGNIAVAGAVGEDSVATGVNGNEEDNSATSSGAAYVFQRKDAIWNKINYLKASNTGASDNFGFSVSVSRGTILIGADLEDSGATGVNGSQASNSASGSGAAYTYVIKVPEIVVRDRNNISLVDASLLAQDFGSVKVGKTSAPFSFTVINRGTAKLKVSSIEKFLKGRLDFIVSNQGGFDIPPGGSRDFTIRFRPTAAKVRNARIEILNNDEDEDPFEILITGKGTP